MHHLALGIVLLRALGLVDPKCLALVVVSTMLLGEGVDRLLDEREVGPDPLVLNVHMHRFLDGFLQAFCLGPGRELAGRTIDTVTTLKFDHLRDVQLVLQTFQLRQRDCRLNAVQVLTVVQVAVRQDVGGSGVVRSCLAEEGRVGSGDNSTLLLTLGETLLVSRVRDWNKLGRRKDVDDGRVQDRGVGVSSSSSSRFGEVR